MPANTPPGARRVEYVRLDDVQLAPRNPKHHDAAGIARSISHHGMGELPLRDERTGRLVAGHGRHAQLADMQAAGKTAPDGIAVDEDGMWLMPVVAGWSSRSDEDAEAYLVGSNHLTVKGGMDDYMLTEILADLAGANLLEVTGYDSGDFDAMEALFNSGAGLGDELDGDLSDEDDQDALDETDRAAWPIIRAQVAPEVHARFVAIDGETDGQKIRVLLDRAGIL